MSTKTHILLVEDNQKLGASIAFELQERGYRVTWKKTGPDAQHVVIDDIALVVLDLMLPGRHGFDLLRDYREVSDVPVIILTARTATEDKVRGLQLGADDYLTKPFWPEELVARIEARLRRPTIRREVDRRIGPLEIELDARLVRLDGEAVELTRVEFDLLAELARRPGMAVPRRRLAERVLDDEREGAERTLDVHISRIRKKFGESSGLVETVWGIGYRLKAPELEGES